MGVRQVARRELAVLGLLTAVLAASVVWYPPDDSGFVLCVFRRLTGVPCMGCGLTRSFCALGKGDAARAVAFHPLGPALFAAVWVYWARGVVAVAGCAGLVALFDRAVMRFYLPHATVVAFMAVWVAGLARRFFG